MQVVFILLGVNVQLEEALGHALLWIACRHHVCELLLGAVCAAVSPHTSKSPDDALSKKISNQLENNGMPALLDESCAKVFQEKSKFFVDRKKELEQLQHKLSKGGDETRYAIPRARRPGTNHRSNKTVKSPDLGKSLF